MTLKFSSIANPGDIQRERIVLRATSGLDIGTFAVFCCQREGDDAVSDGNIPAAFWLSNKEVDPGDLVILYTKAGQTSEKTNKNGSKSYFYYWNLEQPIWHEDKRPILINISGYDFGS